MNLPSFELHLARIEALRACLILPLWKKAAMLAAAFFLPLALYGYFGWMPQQEEIRQIQRQVDQQQHIYRRNLKLTRYLPRKKKEYAYLSKQLRVALNMLPKKSQIPDLLEEVTRAGKNSGLEFTVFKPMPEVSRQFYAEVPVDFTVTGSYRQLAVFLKRVGEMPRIVDMKNMALSRQRGSLLAVTGHAVTYRFIEESKKKKQRKGRRR